MLNPFKIKKWAAFLIAAMFPTIVFFMFLTIYGNFFIAIGAWMVVVLLALMVGFKMLSNPFSLMLEGKGLLAFNLDSKGNLSVFVVGLDRGSLLKGFSGNSDVSADFDRSKVYNLSKPVKALKKAQVANIIDKDPDGNEVKEKGLVIGISESELNDARFAFNQFPVLLYNELSQSFIKKSELSTLEKERIAFDKLTQLNKSVERLASQMFGFTRTIGEYFKPSKNLAGGLPNWVIFMLVIVVGFLIIMLIVKGSGGLGGGAGVFKSALGNAQAATSPITPMG